MPRRSILSTAERASLLALPDAEDELIRHYTLSDADLSLIRQRRGDANRLGVAVQLCLLRYPGQGLLPDAAVSVSFCTGSDGNCVPMRRAGHSMPNAKKPGVSICSNYAPTCA